MFVCGKSSVISFSYKFTPWYWILKVLKCKNKTNQWVELKGKIWKTCSFVNLHICLIIIFTPRVMVIKMSKTAHFCIFCWWLLKISHSLGKKFNCISAILFRSFRKLCSLFGFQLPLARCQPLYFCFFYIYIFLPSISYEQ